MRPIYACYLMQTNKLVLHLIKVIRSTLVHDLFKTSVMGRANKFGSIQNNIITMCFESQIKF
jgi:hypothetical protein